MSSNMHYSLLDGSVITVRYRNGQTSNTNLPEIFCGLLEDTIVSFEALQPHQQQAWYSFLVQLAAMAVARENDGKIPTTPDQWKKLLVNLSDGSEAAWHLVVDDVSQPAFMQPPVPEGSIKSAGYKSDYLTPDHLDMLITSRNHDLKRTRILSPKPEHWIYSLVNLQTLEGYSGGGGKNRGIVRMNSGYGNRPFFGISKEISWGQRFLRDLQVLLNKDDDQYDSFENDGHTLLWLYPWSGKKEEAINLFKCHPYFIEICRRIRFTIENSKLICWKTGTKTDRISTPDDFSGITYDPWTPIDKSEVKSLSVGKNGLTYDLINEVFNGQNFRKSITMKFQKDEKDGAYLICQALVRGQSKTHGLHKRIIVVPNNVARLFIDDPSERKKLAKISANRVKLVEETQVRILRPTLSALLSSGTDQKVDYSKVAPWINRFDQEIDRRFFESLWASVDLDQEEAKCKWEGILLEEAEKIFKEAERSTPIAQLRRLRALSKARSMFYGQAHKIFEYAGKQETLTQ